MPNTAATMLNLVAHLSGRVLSDLRGVSTSTSPSRPHIGATVEEMFIYDAAREALWLS